MQGGAWATRIREGLMAADQVWVGLDISKDAVDVAVWPTAQQWRVTTNEAGLSALATALQALHPAGIVVEASGGYETTVVTTLALVPLPVAVVNPRQVRDFAKGLQRLAKTDAIDAAVLARFGDVTRPAPRRAHRVARAGDRGGRGRHRHAHSPESGVA